MEAAAEEKLRSKNVRRVELHGHTWYSCQACAMSPKELLDTALILGISGMAVTDYGYVSALPEIANHRKQRGVAGFKLAAGMDAMTESLAEEFCTPELRDAWGYGQHMLTMIAVNETGRRNLYFNTSMGSISGHERRDDPPTFSPFLIGQMREGILLGSSGEKGELFELLAEKYRKKRERHLSEIEQDIRHLVNYLDFLEIFPYTPTCGLDKGTVIRIHKDIVRLGEEYGKPVAASAAPMCARETRDVDMLNYAYDKDTPLRPFLKTAELLEELSYLGEDNAYEIVVEQPEKLMSRMEPYALVTEKKWCPEVLCPFSKEELADWLNQKYWAMVPSRTKGRYKLRSTPFSFRDEELIFNWKNKREKELCLEMLSGLEDGLQIYPAANYYHGYDLTYNQPVEEEYYEAKGIGHSCLEENCRFVPKAAQCMETIGVDETHYCLIPSEMECEEELPTCISTFRHLEMISVLQFPIEVLKHIVFSVTFVKDCAIFI